MTGLKAFYHDFDDINSSMQEELDRPTITTEVQQAIHKFNEINCLLLTFLSTNILYRVVISYLHIL